MPHPCVIAATDLTPRSLPVAGRAAQLAARLGARLILVHVRPEDGGAAGRPGFLGRGRAAASLDERLFAEAHALGAESRLLTGRPEIVLADLALDEAAVLMVLGLHRERRVLDLLRLTTMERIVLASSCPLMIARQPGLAPFARVLAPTDFGAASAASLAMAARIAPEAEFHAIHALQLPLGAAFTPGHRETEAALSRAEAQKAAFLAMPGLPVLAEPPEIVPGGVHEVLAFRRAEINADLVCIGAMSGRDPRQLGNYARDLMRAPPTDLLVAKAL